LFLHFYLSSSSLFFIEISNNNKNNKSNKTLISLILIVNIIMINESNLYY
jgi:hypothetical protein